MTGLGTQMDLRTSRDLIDQHCRERARELGSSRGVVETTRALFATLRRGESL